MKIDTFCHVLPKKFKNTVEKLGISLPDYTSKTRSLTDLDLRFRIMDKYEDYVQLLTVSGMHQVTVKGHPKAIELVQMVNDELAELVAEYPDRFVGAVACLPLQDIDATLKEAERSIKQLKFRGVEIWAGNAKPLDHPDFRPLYEQMWKFNLPIWIHPTRTTNVSDYIGESESKYGINSLWGWVYETTAAMTRLVFGRVLQDFPGIKFITHHAGAMVPFFAARIVSHYENYDMIWKRGFMDGLTQHPIEYFRMFYNDTAINGNPSGLKCAFDFFGPERLLFATDMPFDTQLGDVSIRETIRAIEGTDIPAADKKRIYEDNVRSIARVPV